MYFKAKIYKIPAYVTFVLLTGAWTVKGMFSIDDFITEFSSPKCPCHILQGQPEQQGQKFPSIDTVCMGSWSLCTSMCR